MSVRNTQNAFVAVRSEGGLLPPDILHRIHTLDESLGGLTAADYRLPENARLNTEISQAWQAIQTHFASFRLTREKLVQEKSLGTSETRTWVQQVLRELGYRELRFVAQAEAIGDRRFLVSHRAGDAENDPPIHIISFSQEIDARAARTGGGETRSPQALMQGYLNASEHQWGVVTNGLVFRLLRENRQIDRALRVEFDLEGMLESENFAEFRLFWLILHRSRFVQPGQRNETAWLEQWTQTASKEGARAMEALRPGVEEAIQQLGEGLLAHPANIWLSGRLKSGDLGIDAYYSQLLRLVYRLLFLLVAEERHLLFTPDADDRIVNRYRKHYSIERLRTEASRNRNREKHQDDLWRSLLVTFDAMRFPQEATALGLDPLGGGLFGAGSCPDVADDAAPDTHGKDRIAGRPLIANAFLLGAIQALSEVTRDGITRRINYRDLDVEELGSVYEGLLEQRPSLETGADDRNHFAFSSSNSRKETGSYYTPSSLVQELLNSALDPVIEQAVADMRTTEDKRKSLLALNVIDPACGSGHFLLGAARRIGRRLAEIEAGEGNEPELADVRRGVREAIRHCIYGVDKNPLAIDLCKTALWIESHEPGAPISFLDHHIKRGDSLVGVFDLDVLEQGIPDGAFTAVTGDDKKIASELKKRNTKERPNQTALMDGSTAPIRAAGLWDDDPYISLLTKVANRLNEIDAMPGNTIDEVKAKADAYHQLHGQADWQKAAAASDLWTYAFFAPLTAGNQRHVPTSATVRRMSNHGDVPGDTVGRARAVAGDVGFFHWPLEFPEVFQMGGFDTVLGNPPWERVKLQEKEFFAGRDDAIATSANKAARTRAIAALEKENPTLLAEFHNAVHQAESASIFLRTSERYPLTGRGDVNLYSVFAEHFRKMIAPTGRAGIIVPTGIATDDTNKFFFADLVQEASLAALFDFENRRALFENVHRSYKFSVITLAGRARQDTRFQAGFFLYDPVDIQDPEKTFTLGAEDIALVNPNTKTVPIFRSARDADLTKQIYQAAPVLVDENKGDEGNPWGVKFNRMFDMSNDSHLFRTREELENVAARLGADGRFRGADGEYLPLYEAKLMHQFDHRFATFERDGKVRDVSDGEHADPNFVVTPRYWVGAGEVDTKASHSREWMVGWRDITNSTNMRTTISGFTPRAGAGDTWLLIDDFQSTSPRIASLVADFNSFVFDYATRQKIGGTHLKFYTFKQLPVLPPETYSHDLQDLITPRVLELTYTAHDMTPFARDLGYEGEPFIWDEERRAQLRADLDGIYAHLYGISRDDFDYILETFPIVKRKDEAEFGEFRTKRLCLEAYDTFANHPAIVAAKPAG